MSQLKVQVIPVTPFQQNCSIVYDDELKRGVVVDPGGDVPTIRLVIERSGVEIEHILLTHGHIDHAGGADQLREELGVKILGPHKADEFLLNDLVASGARFGMQGVRPVVPDKWLEEGDTVAIAGMSFAVLHAPGHSPGSVVFFSAEHRFALMGDVLFQGSVGRTDFPYGSSDTLLKAIRDKIIPLGDDVVFLPGHGKASEIGVERRTNPFLQGLDKL